MQNQTSTSYFPTKVSNTLQNMQWQCTVENQESGTTEYMTGVPHDGARDESSDMT